MYAGYTSTHAPVAQREEFAPMLFPLSVMENVPNMATPRAATPKDVSGMSAGHSRRSLHTTPGSMQTDRTPAPGPPRRRLGEDDIMEDPGSARQAPSPQMAGPSMMGTGAGVPASSYKVIPTSGQAQDFDDVWVTVFGFSQAEVPLVLQEFHKCGDILSWGTYGQPQANFLHVQFQNKYAAQRALQRNGEQLTPGLVVGVKPLDARHRRAIETYSADSSSSPLQLLRPQPVSERPYRVEHASGQVVPRPRGSLVGKVYEYVFGV